MMGTGANAVSDAIVAKRVPGFMEAFRRFVYESRGGKPHCGYLASTDWLPDRRDEALPTR